MPAGFKTAPINRKVSKLMLVTKENTLSKDQTERGRLLSLAAFGFITLHLGCLLVFWVGFSWVAFGACIALYLARAFGISAGFHRLLSHRAFKTGRVMQFLFAWLGTTALQRGPLWWVSHHRHHHPNSDTPNDVHSPIGRGFWWSHMGWILCGKFNETNTKLVRDLMKFPELRWMDRYFLIPPVVLVGLLWLAGALLERYAPHLGTNAAQMMVYGFVLSTVILYHVTFSVNSIAHLIGRRRFMTSDESRNNVLVAMFSVGEGWHNNHHFYPSSARLGFFWWEFDPSYYILLLLNRLGLIWEMKFPPARIYQGNYSAQDVPA